ncbi:MAG: hypothetical protein CVV42_12865 [Candidatus Riflebacteria bacterium HGW-Riflebacteria-2]|jgi:hypothetical protein|nr:MAG: hypothetical protein CVV42_12865 [Candidatus Riflebacteria bacterium HGW-Riflebacteria-2]
MKKSVNSFLCSLILLVSIIWLGSLAPGFANNPFDVDSTITIPKVAQQEEDPAVADPDDSSNAVVTDNEIVIEPDGEPANVVPAVIPTEENGDANSDLQAASAPAEEGTSKILPGYEDQDISIDGDNYCGQFAMTSVFKGLGIDKEAQDIYKATNPRGIFTAPPVLVDYLNKNGVKAQQRQNCSIEDIAKKIDDGKPVIVLVDSGSGTPHWVNIYGYTRDESGKIISVRMRDSYWGTDSGHEMDIHEFNTAWKHPFGDTFIGKVAGYSNLMIDINGSSSGTPFSTATEDNMASGINEVVTGWSNRDWGQLAGGVSKLVLGIPGAVVSIGSRLPSAIGSTMTSWGKDRMNQGGVGNTILGGAAVAGGSVLRAGGWVANQIGNASSSVAKAIGNGIKSLFGR